MNKQTIVHLLVLADTLDRKGFYKEANILEGLLNKDCRKKAEASLEFKKISTDYLLANTEEERAKGLSGVDPLRTKGMLFAFPESDVVSFHNKDCLAPITVYWMNNLNTIGQSLLPKYDGKIVEVTSPGPVNMVLEQFAQLKRSYDYGESPYSNMQDYKSVKDYLQKRREQRAELMPKVASCPHGNTINIVVEGQPLEYCLDCQQAIDKNKQNRGDWSKDYFHVNVAPYNDIGFFDAKPIDKIDFYS